MTDQDQEPLFKELDGNTLFTAAYFWEYEDPVSREISLRSAVGMFAWEDVNAPSTISPDVLKGLPEPRCSVVWCGQYVYLNVHYKTIATAWRKYRLRYGAKHLTWTTRN